MKVDVDPQSKLREFLSEAYQKMGDLTVPLQLIAQQWFKSNAAIFTLQGPGGYVDLTELYKKFKTKHLGSPYPILKLSGQLEASITNPGDANAISQIINKVSLTVGTRVQSAAGASYAYFLHNGTSKMPARPVVLFGNEQVAPQALNNRIESWRQILSKWVGEQIGVDESGA